MTRIALKYTLALLASTTAAVAASAHEIDEAARSQGDAIDEVYAFLPSFVMDFKRNRFLNSIRSKSYSLHDCSTKDALCIRSSEFRFEVPKSCAERQAFFDSRGTAQMPIVASFDRRRRHTSERVEVVYNPEHPDYALVIRQSGVSGLIYRTTGDLTKLLTEQSLTRADRGAKDVGFAYTKLRSAVPLGKCAKVSPG